MDEKYLDDFLLEAMYKEGNGFYNIYSNGQELLEKIHEIYDMLDLTKSYVYIYENPEYQIAHKKYTIDEFVEYAHTWQNDYIQEVN